MERLDRFGQQVGQRFVGDRTDRDLPDRLPQQPAAVGSDPDNILVTVLQQRKNAAVDVDLLQLVTPLDGSDERSQQHAAHPKAQHVSSLSLITDERAPRRPSSSRRSKIGKARRCPVSKRNNMPFRSVKKIVRSPS